MNALLKWMISVILGVELCFSAVAQRCALNGRANPGCGSLLGPPHYVEFGTPVLRRGKVFSTGVCVFSAHPEPQTLTISYLCRDYL